MSVLSALLSARNGPLPHTATPDVFVHTVPSTRMGRLLPGRIAHTPRGLDRCSKASTCVLGTVGKAGVNVCSS